MLGLIPTMVQPDSAILASRPCMWVDARWVDPTPGAAKRDRTGTGNDWTHTIAGGGGLAVGAAASGARALIFTGSANERLSTPAIDLTGTPAITFAAVFESVSVAFGFFCEFSANYNLQEDAFAVTRTNTGELSGSMKNGPLGADYNLFATTDSFGATQVIAFFVLDRSQPAADETTVRVDCANAAGAKSSSADGSGNFGNYVLYIADRAAGGVGSFDGPWSQALLWPRALSTAEQDAACRALLGIVG